MTTKIASLLSLVFANEFATNMASLTSPTFANECTTNMILTNEPNLLFWLMLISKDTIVVEPTVKRIFKSTPGRYGLDKVRICVKVHAIELFLIKEIFHQKAHMTFH
jgi:hypothetical protein